MFPGHMRKSVCCIAGRFGGNKVWQIDEPIDTASLFNFIS